MGNGFIQLARLVLKSAVILLILNEIRGLILAVPVLYGIYQAGGSWMAWWIGFCALAGIALSVIIPMLAARKLEAALTSRFS